MHMLKVGLNYYIPASDVKFLGDYTSRQMMQIVKNAKQRGIVIDATRNKSILSIIMTNTQVILSPVSLTTLLKNLKSDADST